MAAIEPIKRDKHDIYPFISATGSLRGVAKGKTVLITGGGKGIGKAMTRQFALAGASHVVIAGRDAGALAAAKSETEAEIPSCAVHAIPADVSSPADVDRIFSSLQTLSLPTPDVLINNVGVNSSTAHVVDSDPKLWWRDWEVNVRGTYLMTRAYLKLRVAEKDEARKEEEEEATIINVSTCIADEVNPNMSAYATSKQAVNRFTEVVQLECAARGNKLAAVRCVAMHPGGIASTDMGQAAPEQFRGRLLDTVELAAGTALYLSSPGARYLAGRFVYADWDMERVERLADEILRRDLLVSRPRYDGFLSTEIVGLPEA